MTGLKKVFKKHDDLPEIHFYRTSSPSFIQALETYSPTFITAPDPGLFALFALVFQLNIHEVI